MDQIFRFDEFLPSEKRKDSPPRANRQSRGKTMRKGRGAFYEAVASPEKIYKKTVEGPINELKLDAPLLFTRKVHNRAKLWQEADGSIS